VVAAVMTTDSNTEIPAPLMRAGILGVEAVRGVLASILNMPGPEPADVSSDGWIGFPQGLGP
jgi:hypothetical protein